MNNSAAIVFFHTKVKKKILISLYDLYAPLTWLGFGLIGYVPNTLYKGHRNIRNTCHLNFVLAIYLFIGRPTA
jgi:hypothetical protein